MHCSGKLKTWGLLLTQVISEKLSVGSVGACHACETPLQHCWAHVM